MSQLLAGDAAAGAASPLQERGLDGAVLDRLAQARRLYAVLDAAGRPSVLAYVRHLLGRPGATWELAAAPGDGDSDSPREAWAHAAPPGVSLSDPDVPAGDDAATMSAGAADPGRVVSLWAGEPGGPNEAICPYLVRVDRELLGWSFGAMAGDPWGVFVVAPPGGARDPNGATVRIARALRRLLRARTPDGQVVYLRWYDPRVLADLLRASTDAELRVMLGNGAVQAFAVTGGAGAAVRLFERRAAPAALPVVFAVPARAS